MSVITDRVCMCMCLFGFVCVCATVFSGLPQTLPRVMDAKQTSK